jgi:RND family efflux transporter MFP subunit
MKTDVQEKPRSTTSDAADQRPDAREEETRTRNREAAFAGSDRPSRGKSLLLGIVIPLVIIGAALIGATVLVKTAPHARQRAPERAASLVEVRPVEVTQEQVVVHAMGTVIAAQEITVQPRVSGRIVETSPAMVPGGRVSAGETLLRIDPSEFEAAVQQAEASLARAKAQLRSAEWELERLDRLSAQNVTQDKEMDNGRTAKAVAEADVAAASAALDKARLNLEWTTIEAPFSGIITSESVDLGAQVSPQSQLATLVGSDEYWVRVSVPVDRLHWIDIPTAAGEGGSAATIEQHFGRTYEYTWQGEVIRLMGDLEPQGRMARLLVSIKDPLKASDANDAPVPLLIGSYVDVSIGGRNLQGVVVINRRDLREDDTVWLMDDAGGLEIRPVEVAFRGRDRVVIRDGLVGGERLVTTDLSTPVDGMPLRIASDASSQPSGPDDPASKPGDEGAAS